ncbi:MAG: guanylate kinase [Rhodopirellula sp.]|nr:guanylate kinase [Rhodopirellula sp.]
MTDQSVSAETSRQEINEPLQVVVLSGPSGSGKSTIVNRLVAESPVKLVKMISATTRPIRVNETHGEDYYFLSDEDFRQKREAGGFVECEEVHSSGFWYGTLHTELLRARDEGGWAFLEIDVKGALSVMEQFPNAITIFLKTPSEQIFEDRLRARGTESEEVIQRRLKTAREELKFADRYRYQVCNDDLDRAVREIIEVLVSREAESNA